MKIGILGAGKIGPKFAKDALTIPGVSIEAIGSRSMNRAREMAAELGAPQAFDSYEAFIEKAKVDLVYIATPHVSHADLTIACLEAGKPVLVEKAFAINSKEARQMVQVSRKNKVFLMEALWSRFMPSLIQAKKWMEEGRIGALCSLHADFGFAAKYDTTSRLFNPELGGGALLDIGIYPVFLALMMLGKPEDVLASAILGETGVDEELGMIFKYPTAIAHLQSSFRSKTPCQARLVGTTGTITIHSRWHHSREITLTNSEGVLVDSWKSSDPWIGYRYEAKHVKECLDQGLEESPIWTLDHSLELMDVLDLIRNQIGLVYPQDK